MQKTIHCNSVFCTPYTKFNARTRHFYRNEWASTCECCVGKEVLECVNVWIPQTARRTLLANTKTYYYSLFNIGCYCYCCWCRQLYCLDFYYYYSTQTHAHRAALHIVDNKRTTMFCSLTFRINKLGCMMSIIELARDRTHTHTQSNAHATKQTMWIVKNREKWKATASSIVIVCLVFGALANGVICTC